jgi:predicted DCC family thiol-disulfide oxidoreductase YuxK
MPELAGKSWSWRGDPAVPDFGERPLFVFDGVCVLCSSGAAFIMRHDREGRVDMASAQGALGAALYRHYGLAMDDTYLFLKGGRAFTKSAGYLELFSVLGGWWRLPRAMQVLPEAWRDWLYDRVAANRYSWFGEVDYCALLTEAQRARLIG